MEYLGDTLLVALDGSKILKFSSANSELALTGGWSVSDGIMAMVLGEDEIFYQDRHLRYKQLKLN